MAATADDPDAAIPQDHRRGRLLSHATRQQRRPIRRWRCAVIAGAVSRSGAGRGRGRRHRSRCSSCTRPGRMRRSPTVATRAAAHPRQGFEGLGLLLGVHRPGEVPRPGHQSAFSDFLRVKYPGGALTSSSRFRMPLSTSSQAAGRAVPRHARRVLCDVPPPCSAVANSTGVDRDAEPGQHAGLAVALQPDIRHVFVVSGAALRQARTSVARAQLKPFESRLDITYLSGLPTARCSRRGWRHCPSNRPSTT